MKPQLSVSPGYVINCLFCKKEGRIFSKAALFASIFSLFLIPAIAQLSLTGELRPRIEYRHGYKTLMNTGQTGAVFISQRTRLNLAYKTEKFKTMISLQDVHVWGSQQQTNAISGQTSLFEAWGEYYITKKFSVKAGRQVLSYDDQRILGSGDWSQQARSHDLMMLKFTDSTFIAHAGFAYNQNGESNTGVAYSSTSGYKQLHFLWLNKHFRSFVISFLALNNGYQSPVSVHSTRFNQTIGTHTQFKKRKFFAAINFYFQTGHDNSTGTEGKIRKVNALLAGAEADYAIVESFSVGAGYERQTGQSQTDTTSAYKNVNHAFNPFYGTNHKFNGNMDYFYNGNHISSVGLQDAFCRMNYKSEKWWAGFETHLFVAAREVLDNSELNLNGSVAAMNKQLGTEIDFTFYYTLSKNASVQAGYSQMFATKTMEALKGGDHNLTQNWAYVMIVLKPDFLN